MTREKQNEKILFYYFDKGLEIISMLNSFFILKMRKLKLAFLKFHKTIFLNFVILNPISFQALEDLNQLVNEINMVLFI